LNENVTISLQNKVMVSSQESLVWDSGDSFFTLLFLNAMYLVFATNCIIIGTVNTENELFEAQLYTVTKLTSLFFGTNLWFYCWFLLVFIRLIVLKMIFHPTSCVSWSHGNCIKGLFDK